MCDIRRWSNVDQAPLKGGSHGREAWAGETPAGPEGYREAREVIHGEQLQLDLDWGKEPWEGVSPRHLTRGSCVVDNSVVRCTSREALGMFDPAQLTLFLQGKSDGT